MSCFALPDVAAAQALGAGLGSTISGHKPTRDLVKEGYRDGEGAGGQGV